MVQVLTSVKQQPPSPRRRVWHEYTIRAEWYFVISSITGSFSARNTKTHKGGKRDTWTVSPRFGLSNWLGESVQLGREKPVIIIERNKEWTRSKTWRNVEFTAAKLSSSPETNSLSLRIITVIGKVANASPLEIY